jgi:hypothetical protein
MFNKIKINNDKMIRLFEESSHAFLKNLLPKRTDLQASFKVSPEALILVKQLPSHQNQTNIYYHGFKDITTSIVNWFDINRFPEFKNCMEEVMSARFKHYGMSGFQHYPPGGYMGWHTNRNAPGWRLYINWVREPGKSFFRYQEPISGQIVTDWDSGMDCRLFRVGDPAKQEHDLWHCVYSETDRISVGYTITDDMVELSEI